MTRLRTAWRLLSSDLTYVTECHIREQPNAQVSVTVTENGRRVDRSVFRGSHDQALHQAWREAVALHDNYRHRCAPQPSPEQRQRHVRSETELRSDLLAAIRRLERSRGDVLRALDALDSQGDQVVSAVEGFRASWEVLDLEHHFLTGRPLSVEQYRKRLSEVGRRVDHLESESP